MTRSSVDFLKMMVETLSVGFEKELKGISSHEEIVRVTSLGFLYLEEFENQKLTKKDVKEISNNTLTRTASVS